MINNNSKTNKTKITTTYMSGTNTVAHFKTVWSFHLETRMKFWTLRRWSQTHHPTPFPSPSAVAFVGTILGPSSTGSNSFQKNEAAVMWLQRLWKNNYPFYCSFSSLSFTTCYATCQALSRCCLQVAHSLARRKHVNKSLLFDSMVTDIYTNLGGVGGQGTDF